MSMEAVKMRQICVRNHSELTTGRALATHLQLDKTCSLQCKIVDEDVMSYLAVITAPSAKADRLLLFNGSDLLGNTIIVENHEDQTVSYAEQAKDTNTKEIEKKYVEVDTTYFNSCYQVRNFSLAMLVHAVESACGFDLSKRLVPISRDNTLYKIDTSDPELYANMEKLTHLGRDLAKVSIKVEKKVVLSDGKVVTRRIKPKDELLITLEFANMTEFSDIPPAEIYQKWWTLG